MSIGLRAITTVTILVLLTPTAQAASVKDVFEKYNLLGQWAQDCSKPPDVNSNWVYINRAMDDGNVQRDYMAGPTTRSWYSIIDKATPNGPEEVEISGQVTGHLFGADRNGEPFVSVWHVEKSRLVPESGSVSGKAYVADRKNISNGASMPWLTKCP